MNYRAQPVHAIARREFSFNGKKMQQAKKADGSVQGSATSLPLSGAHHGQVWLSISLNKEPNNLHAIQKK